MGSKQRKTAYHGGAEDKTGSCLILRRFLELAGGEQTAVAILTTATENPEVATEYRRLFLQLGAGEVIHLNVNQRAEAGSRQTMAILAGVNGVFSPVATNCA